MEKSNRLTIEEVRSIEGFKNISDAKAEELIDDAMALARLCLDLVDDKHRQDYYYINPTLE